MKTPANATGFTLIELVVALAIFALLSVMAYSGLRLVLDARERTAQQAERLATLQLAFTVIGRDLEQAVNRPVRDEFGDRAVAMNGTGTQIEFTRAGWRNPAGLRRSELQRVAYILEGATLRRLSWSSLDRVQSSAPFATTLLEGVQEVEIRFLDTQEQWLTFWPAPEAGTPAASALPRAVEISVETEHWGRITRLFRTIPALAPTLPLGATPAPET